MSERQARVLEYITLYMLNNGYPPTIREIGTALDIRSTSTVYSYLAALEDKGYLIRDPSKPRALQLCDRPAQDVATQQNQAVLTDVRNRIMRLLLGMSEEH